MSDKTFLQDLESIKRKAEACYNEYPTDDIKSAKIKEIIADVQKMINLCIELQLAIMKQERMKNK